MDTVSVKKKLIRSLRNIFLLCGIFLSIFLFNVDGGNWPILCPYATYRVYYCSQALNGKSFSFNLKWIIVPSFQLLLLFLKHLKFSYMLWICSYIYFIFFLTRILFWTDWDANFPRIESASMSGAERKIIYKDMDTGAWPNGLTVDHFEKRIVWTDAR